MKNQEQIIQDPPIQDQNKYLNSLRNTFIDKAFFVEKLPDYIDTIIDYGCADGSFLKFLKNIYGNKFLYFGVERDPKMIELAKENHINVCVDLKRLPFTADFNRVCINFSSSLHEIFCGNHDVREQLTFNLINSWKPAVISIRDMYVTVNQSITDFSQNKFCLECLQCLAKELPLKTSDFLKCYDLNTPVQCMHFLLKYMYDENWERECKENYLSFTQYSNGLRDKLCKYYDLKWELEYNLPYLLSKWEEDELLTEYTRDFIKKYITTHTQLVYIMNKRS